MKIISRIPNNKQKMVSLCPDPEYGFKPTGNMFYGDLIEVVEKL